MSYPTNKKSRGEPVKLDNGLKKAVKEFLKSDLAKSRGFKYESDFINDAVRDLLNRYQIPVNPDKEDIDDEDHGAQHP